MQDSENSKSPITSLSYSQAAWLLSILSQTEYRAGVREKFKRVWGFDIPEEDFNAFTDKHKKDIVEVRQATRGEIDTHAMSDPYTRMNKFVEIMDLAITGTCIGIDKQGDPVMKVDLTNALNAAKACREEKQLLIENELALLGMMIKAKAVNPLVGGDTNIDPTQSLQGDSTTTVTDVTGTSDTLKHLEFNG